MGGSDIAGVAGPPTRGPRSSRGPARVPDPVRGAGHAGGGPRLDLVLGAFHSKLRLSEDQTERYLAGIRNPHVHVLAHPRCRMYGRRVGLRPDWPRVFEEAAALDKAVEVDANPNRQDLDVELL